MNKILAVCIVLATAFGCAGTHPVPWVSTPEYEVEYNLAWDLTVDLFSERYTLETVDKQSGFIKTAWNPVEVKESDQELLGETDQLGVRITCQVEGDFPFQLKLKVERGVLRDGEWSPVWVEYCRESICQRCEAGRTWGDQELEQRILRDLSQRLQN